MSLAAYQRVAQVTETPRQTEYRLLGDVCRELTEVAGEEPTSTRRREALHWNRRVWMTFAVESARADNPMEAALKARIVSLGMWVYRYTDDAMWKEADIQPLIDVNLAIIKGLMGKTAEAA